MRDARDHYKYIAKYIDNFLIISKDLMSILNQMKKPKGPYDFKGIGSPEYYLCRDVRIEYCDDSIVELLLSSKTCLLQIVRKLQL